MTPRDIVSRAYAMSGLIGEGDIPTAGEITSGFHELNNIIDELRAVSLWEPLRGVVHYTPLVSKHIFSIGRIPQGSFLFEQVQFPQPFLVQAYAATSDITVGDPLSIYSETQALPSIVVREVTPTLVSFVNPLKPDASLRVNATGATVYFDTPEMAIAMNFTGLYTVGDEIVYTDSSEFGYTGIITAIDPDVSVTAAITAIATSTPTSSIYAEGPGDTFLVSNNILPDMTRGILYPEGSIEIQDLTVPDIITPVDPEYLYSVKYLQSQTLHPSISVSDADWEASRISQITATYPTHYRYTRLLPTSQIEFSRPYEATLYPLTIEYPKHIDAFDSLDDLLQLRPGYSGYLEAQLAVNLLATSVMENPQLGKIARTRYKRLQHTNVREPGTAVLPTISTRSHYNYKDDSFYSR